MAPRISVIIAAWNRAALLEKTLASIKETQTYPNLELVIIEDGDDGGATKKLAFEYDAVYVQKSRAEKPVFQNPGRVHNIGVRASSGDILIFQGGEIKYKEGKLEDLVAPIVADPYVATSALVEGLNQDGSFDEWYTHPRGRRPNWFANFCLAVDRHRVYEIRGFEESFFDYGYGFEDDYFTYLLSKNGVRFQYVESFIASHQWHSRATYEVTHGSAPYYEKLVAEVESGQRPAIANLTQNWGQL